LPETEQISPVVVRRNQTKVGLKVLDNLAQAHAHISRRNQTKVGLKANSLAQYGGLYAEEIRPRWD